MDQIHSSSQKCLIFDIGNATTKFGLSSEQKPHEPFDTMVRTRLYKYGLSGFAETKQTGQRVNHSCLYKYSIPIKRGIIDSEEETIIILRHILEETKSKTLDNIPVFICDNANSSAKQKFRLAEILTNDFKASSMYFADQSILALYGMGKTSGCILDIGHGTSQIACIYDNFKIDQCCEALNFGGYDVECRLNTELNQRGIQINPRNELLLLRKIKQDYCEVIPYEHKNCLSTNDFSRLPSKDQKEETKLPDGEPLILGEAKYKVNELFFYPVDNRPDTIGLHTFLHNIIERADIGLKNELYSDINIVGGASKTTGLLQRLEYELRAISHKNTRIIMKHRLETEGYETWYGAKVVVSSNNYDFLNLWITKAELDEFGEQIILRKCT